VGLVVKNLSYKIDEFQIFCGIDLEVQSGEVHALVGPNGAGKSTLFATIVGEKENQGGEVSWNGQPLEKLPLWRRVQKGVGYLAQESLGFNKMTVSQNLMVLPTVNKNEVEAILHKVDLFNLKDRMLGVLSGGERRRIDIARLLLLNSRLWILDEPFSALDIESVKWMVKQILAAKSRGVTILVTDHALAQVMQIADRISILERGAILLSGTVKELATDALFIERYSMN
jgi:lipopolysaccharide export system ATP-binding protein